MSKKTLGNYTCFQLLVMIVLIALILTSKFVKFVPNANMYNINNMHTNWQKPFYNDIVVLDDPSQCAGVKTLYGSNYVPIFTYRYPGMKQSCDCSENVIFEG